MLQLPLHYETGFLNMTLTIINNNNRQSGVVLVISLIVLLLLTIIGVTAMQMTGLEEKMAGNLRNHNTAFQAAESALREAEIYLDDLFTVSNPLKITDGPFQDAGKCVAGLCGELVLSPSQFRTLAGKRIATTSIIGIVSEPQYTLELLDMNINGVLFDATFRITAIAWGGTTNSVVQLQSTYKLSDMSIQQLQQ